MKNISKSEAEIEIKDFFENRENKIPREIRKIKKMAMSHSIKLKDYRKKFCKNCFSALKGKTRIEKKMKSITCKNCGKTSRWKIKD